MGQLFGLSVCPKVRITWVAYIWGVDISLTTNVIQCTEGYVGIYIKL
jgi:hypothetical protein